MNNFQYDDKEEDDMANELNYIRESYVNNGGRDPFGRKLTPDELLMIGVIDEEH